MKRYLSLAMIFAGALAFADSVTDPVATESWLLQVLTFVSTAKGLTTIGLAAGVVQLVMLGFKTPLAAFTGRWRFVIVSLLTVAGLIVGSMATGATFSAALGQAPVLAAVQVFLDQAWRQLFTAKGSV